MNACLTEGRGEPEGEKMSQFLIQLRCLNFLITQWKIIWFKRFHSTATGVPNANLQIKQDMYL